MSTDARKPGWFTEQQAVVTLTLVSVLLAALVVLPYLQYVLFGIVLAYMMWPLRRRLTRYLRNDMSALVLTGVAVIAIPLPFLYIVVGLSQQALAFIESVEEDGFDIETIEATLLDRGIEVDIGEVIEENQEIIVEGLEVVARRVLESAQELPNIVIGLTITVFVLFVLLRDGNMLIDWVRTMTPISDEFQDELHESLDRLMWASVVGNVAAGFIQAAVLGLGFLLLGFDNVLLLTVLTFIVALLPLVGAFVVWVPLVVYLALTGQAETAVILFFIGSLVSASDFYTRPIIIGHSAALNSAVIVVGVFGGLIAFGPIGILIGPVLLGGAKIAVEAMMDARNRDIEAGGSGAD